MDVDPKTTVLVARVAVPRPAHTAQATVGHQEQKTTYISVYF